MDKKIFICLALVVGLVGMFSFLHKDIVYSIKEVKAQTEKYNNSKQDISTPEKFAEYIKTVVKNDDIEDFSNLVSYPITIYVGENGKSITVENKEELIRLGVERLFTDEFVDNVCNEELFHNYQGYMMGNYPNLWFDYSDNGKLVINTISIEE